MLHTASQGHHLIEHTHCYKGTMFKRFERGSVAYQLAQEEVAHHLLLAGLVGWQVEQLPAPAERHQWDLPGLQVLFLGLHCSACTHRIAVERRSHRTVQVQPNVQ